MWEERKGSVFNCIVLMSIFAIKFFFKDFLGLNEGNILLPELKEMLKQDLPSQVFSGVLRIMSLLSLTLAATGWRTCLTIYLIMTE